MQTFSFCNALHRVPARGETGSEPAGGLFHAAMSIYVDRFLNIPGARLPSEWPLEDLPSRLPRTFAPIGNIPLIGSYYLLEAELKLLAAMRREAMQIPFSSGIPEHVKKEHQDANFSIHRCRGNQDSRCRDLQV